MIDYAKIDEEMKRIKMLYRFKKDCCITLINTDNIKIKEYIKKSILSIDTDTIPNEKIIFYDFYKNKDKSLNEEYKNLCKKKGNLLILTGMEDYAKYLKTKGKISDIGDFYMHVFCIPRDDLYLKNNTRMILITNQTEYKMFVSDYCDDFTSYAMYKTNIDEMLKEKNEKQEISMNEEDER